MTVYVTKRVDETSSDGMTNGIVGVYDTHDKAYKAMIDVILEQIKQYYDEDTVTDKTSPGCYDLKKGVEDYTKKDIEDIVEWCNGSISDTEMYINLWDCEYIHTSSIQTIKGLATEIVLDLQDKFKSISQGVRTIDRDIEDYLIEKLDDLFYLNYENERLRKEIGELKSDNEQLENEIDDCDKQIEEITNERDELKEKVEELSK